MRKTHAYPHSRTVCGARFELCEYPHPPAAGNGQEPGPGAEEKSNGARLPAAVTRAPAVMHSCSASRVTHSRGSHGAADPLRQLHRHPAFARSLLPNPPPSDCPRPRAKRIPPVPTLRPIGPVGGLYPHRLRSGCWSHPVTADTPQPHPVRGRSLVRTWPCVAHVRMPVTTHASCHCSDSLVASIRRCLVMLFRSSDRLHSSVV